MPHIQSFKISFLAVMLLALSGNIGINIAVAQEDGEKLFKRCKACHTVTGVNKIGPHLNGVVGRKAGTVEGYKYSPAMKEIGIVWDFENLDKYLENPRKFLPKGKMVFAGLKKPEQRKAVIDYIATFE